MNEVPRPDINPDGLLTRDDRERMLENGRKRAWTDEADECDLLPVVKLVTPDANCVWLLAALNPAEPDIAFGLCDLGMGYPEVGSVRISELESVRGRLGLPVTRAADFVAERTIDQYAEEARASGCIRV